MNYGKMLRLSLSIMSNRTLIAFKKNINGDFDISSENLELFAKAITDSNISNDVQTGITGSGIFVIYDSGNFLSCENRSENIEYRKVNTCCGDIAISGYACNKKKIFNILAQDCYQCEEYVKRNNGTLFTTI